MQMTLRITLAVVGVIFYEVVQWDYAFPGSPILEAIGLLLIILALMPSH